MNILLIANPWFPTNLGNVAVTHGGVETYIHNLTKHIADQGHYVTVVATDDSQNINSSERITLVGYGADSKHQMGWDKRINNGRYKATVKDILAKSESPFDAIVSNNPAFVVIRDLIQLTKELDYHLPVLVIPHGLPVGRFDITNAEKLATLKDDFTLLSLSDLATKYWEDKFGIRTSYLGLAVADPVAKYGLGLSLNQGIDTSHISYIARIHPEKGIDAYVRVMNYLRDDFRGEFFGYSSDADKKVPSKFQVKRKGEVLLEVEGVGYDDTISKAINKSHNISWSPLKCSNNEYTMRELADLRGWMAQFSQFETGSVVAIENMALGLPTITFANENNNIVPIYLDKFGEDRFGAALTINYYGSQEGYTVKMSHLGMVLPKVDQERMALILKEAVTVWCDYYMSIYDKVEDLRTEIRRVYLDNFTISSHVDALINYIITEKG